eukprot:6393097-Pyramimonas_sp.AAC.1
MAVLPPSGSDPVPVCVCVCACVRACVRACACVTRGVIHDNFPQTPAMSEHVGVALCEQVANRPAALGDDCMSAIELAQKELSQQMSVR